MLITKSSKTITGVRSSSLPHLCTRQRNRVTPSLNVESIRSRRKRGRRKRGRRRRRAKHEVTALTVRSQFSAAGSTPVGDEDSDSPAPPLTTVR